MIAVGAVVLLLVLIGLAVFALRNALTTKPAEPGDSKKSQAATVQTSGSGGAPSTATQSGGPRPTHSKTSADPASVPTLRLDVTGAKSRVFVRIPGGDVLLDDTLTHGRRAEFDQSALDVVIDDGGAVKVRVNGKQRPTGGPGQRLQFTAHGG